MRDSKSGLFWQFSGGFVLGTLALVVGQPSEARHALMGHVEEVLPLR